MSLQNVTRMHSSRMRTARLLPVSPSMHCSRGVYLVPWWGVYLVLGGGVPGLGVVPGPRGRGVPGPGGCTWSWGGYLPRYSPSPLWTEFLTHASENTTSPQTSFAGGKKRSKVPLTKTVRKNVTCEQGLSVFAWRGSSNVVFLSFSLICWFLPPFIVSRS